MSKFYHVIREGEAKWIKSPNNGGECCQSQEDTVEELNRLLKQLEESEKLRVEYREALKPLVKMYREFKSISDGGHASYADAYYCFVKGEFLHWKKAEDLVRDMEEET